DKLPATAEAAGHITYVLVINKGFKEDPRYQEFLHLFQESVGDLNNPDILLEAIRKYKNIEFTRKEVELWSRLGIRYVFTAAQTRG
ncbi:MAG: hypothetical protein PHO01_12100, partial [Desulfotomaculaceae bacterium]|nr:hypothetical protein [Desulfotomaculaceae bacterium]